LFLAPLIRLNFWVAFCAFLLSEQQLYFFAKNLQLSFFIFFSVLASYNLQRLYTLRKSPFIVQFDRWKWVSENKKLIFLIGIIASLICTIFFFTFNWKSKLIIIFTTLISLFYIFIPRFLPNGLRAIPFLKAGFVALSWAFVMVLLPYFSFEQKTQTNVLLHVTEIFLFMFSITQPFDIRDLELDKKSNIKTLPMVIGIENTKFLCLFTLLISLVISFFIYENTFFIGIALSAAYTAFLIVFSTPSKSEYYYSFFLESTMLVRVLLVYLTIKFF
jgi:4-hydroxybenzoate polyprenyltransferase